MTLSSHKVYGPKGVGCLFVGQGIKIEPILHGGGQEFGMRSGTVNVAGIVGFAKAAEMIVDNMEAEQKRISELARKLVAGAKQTIADVELNGDEKIKVPNIVNLRFARIEGESLLVKLDIAGVEVSTGSACSSPKLKPSHVLMSCGATPEQAHGSVRFSIGRFTTQEDIDRVLAILPKAVDSLRKISPIK
jgi:cysteine desulfurase